MNNIKRYEYIETAVGLQDVDGLKTSNYFAEESKKYVDGLIDIDELEKNIQSYYLNKDRPTDRSDEADIVSARIARMLENEGFVLSVGQLLAIHKELFNGLIDNAGEIRDFNFIKKEWVLGGASVSYCDYREIEMALDYDIREERRTNFSILNKDQMAEHIAYFIANLWQIHAFKEGNTRTSAVFLIKYLRSLGFNVNNEIFQKNSWYFRNALVRANYNNITLGIYADIRYLKEFIKQILYGGTNVFLNRNLLTHKKTDNHVTSGKMDLICELMMNNPDITLKEISSKIGLSIRTTKNIIAVLKTNGTIERIGGKKFGSWKINIK